MGVGPTPRAHPRKDAGSLWHRTRETSIPLQIPLRLQTPGDYLRCPHNALLLGMPHPSNTPASLAFLERLIGGTMPFLTSEPLTPALPALSPFLPSPHLTPGMLEGGKLLSPLGVTFSPYRPQDILQTHQIPSLFVLISVCSALTGQRHRLRPPCAWSIAGVEQTFVRLGEESGGANCSHTLPEKLSSPGTMQSHSTNEAVKEQYFQGDRAGTSAAL